MARLPTMLGLTACLLTSTVQAEQLPTIYCEETDGNITLFTIKGDTARMESPPSSSGLVGLPPAFIPVTVKPEWIYLNFGTAGIMSINRLNGAFRDTSTNRQVGTCGTPKSKF